MTQTIEFKGEAFDILRVLIEPMEVEMKALNLTTLILVILGGLNWGLFGMANYDLVAVLFGAGSFMARAVYVIVGLSALWQLVPLIKAFQIDEPGAERHV